MTKYKKTRCVSQSHISPEKEKCNCVVEYLLRVCYWMAGCCEGCIIGWLFGCHDMELKYDFMDLDAWFKSGLRTGYEDGYMFGNL